MSLIKFVDKQNTESWVEAFARSLKRPTVILLSGPMGAGKTQFTRWILQVLGAADVASPTFAIHHAYETPGGTVDHVDLYRVENDQDLEGAGFWDLFANDDGLVIVEWADRLPDDAWPRHWTKIKMDLAVGVDEQRALEVKQL